MSSVAILPYLIKRIIFRRFYSIFFLCEKMRRGERWLDSVERAFPSFLPSFFLCRSEMRVENE